MLIHQTWYLIKRRFHFHIATHVMCPWSFTSLTSFNCFLSQLGYLDLISTNYMCCRWLTSFNCFFKPVRISWSNFNQLHVLMLTLRTHDIMIFRGMNGKLASENFFWKWISRGRRKWWNDCFILSLIATELCMMA